mmetsp:Transcript_688/g.673  ORF Transcript_688/g.673 Transcript_688/m.673 type:complete len:160 (+) Transcript_688:1314-1793(+)
MSFKYLQSIEKKVRIQELVIVLNRLFKNTGYPIVNVRFLEYILNAILESGRKEHIDVVMETINHLNIPLSLQMQQIYFQCFDKERGKVKKRPPLAALDSTLEYFKFSEGAINDTVVSKEESKSSDAASFKKRREIKLLETVIKSGKLRRRTFKSYSQRK